MSKKSLSPRQVMEKAADVCAIFASSDMESSWDDVIFHVCDVDSMTGEEAIKVMDTAWDARLDAFESMPSRSLTEHWFRSVWAEAEAILRCELGN